MCYKAATYAARPLPPRSPEPREGAIFSVIGFQGSDPSTIALSIMLLVVSLVIHEVAHGWVALLRGDTTARDRGRLTLNPLPHIDLFWTILLPTILLLTTGFVFGGAKPVPVDFHRLRKPYRDMALVSLAGPASNFLLAILFALVLTLLERFGVYEGTILREVLRLAVFFNCLLAAFNLIPIPPLDGSRVMAWLLPGRLREGYVRLESVGMLLIFMLFFTGVLIRIVEPILAEMWAAVFWIVSLGGTV